MDEYMTPYNNRNKKGGGSFVRKITLRQTVRDFWHIVSLCILITLIFIGALILYAEATAPGLIPASGESVSSYSQGAFEVTPYEGEVVNNIHHQLRDRFNMLPGFRGFRYTGGTEHWWQMPGYIQYIITTPYGDGGLAIAFTPGLIWTFFLYGMGIFLVIQILNLLTGIGQISRSVRKTLRPINQLAFATHQSMTAQTAPPPKQKDTKIELGSTIDTLNAINESRLDTRIDVAKERAELRGLAQAINNMLDRVDSAYRSQLRFVSDASHELRTPISVIQGYANLLDRWGKEDEKILDESISAIKSEASNMKDLVEQLLFLARSDNNSITMKMEYIDLSALVQEVARESEMIDTSHKIEYPQRDPLYISGDAQLLKQALRILMDNALKYTPENGKIILDAREIDNKAAISVTDSGVGIGAEDLPRLFDRFYRADVSRTRQTGGAGLGLSIAKWVVDSHGGVIDVLSREGFGTRMTIKLDLALSNATTYAITPMFEMQPSHTED